MGHFQQTMELIRIDCNVEAIVLKRREDLRGVLSDDLLKLQDRAEKQIG